MAEDVVKSVGRVFEVLELFSASRQPLNATQVERRLNYPQSSTLALLKSLVKLGYLSFDRIERSYFPTIRIAHLGKWLENSLYGNAEIETLMAEVSEQTGESVVLSCQNDLHMQLLHLVPGRGPLRLNFTAGDTAPLFRSAIGIAALADQADNAIAKLVARANRRPDHPAVQLARIVERVSAVRENGYAFWSDADAHGVGIGAIAWPLGGGNGLRPVILAVAGPSESIAAKADHIVPTVRSALRAHLP